VTRVPGCRYDHPRRSIAGAIYLIGYFPSPQGSANLPPGPGRRHSNDRRHFRPAHRPRRDRGAPRDLGPWAGRSEIIRLHFSAAVARLVAERKVHPSQVAQRRQDESLDVDLKAPITTLLVRADDVLFADAPDSTELGLELIFRSQDDS
jgi:hypothetical protein